MDRPATSTSADRFESERQIFLAAIKISNSAERDAFLDKACQNNVELRKRICRLIDVHDSSPPNLLQRAIGSEEPDDSTSGISKEEGVTRFEGATDTTDLDISQHPSIGRYKLLEELGQGGMGTVYMARQTDPINRMVAVKIINPGMNSREVLARFEAERQALALMSHANIASVFDGGTTDSGLPYFAMELVRGVPLTEFCQQEKLSLDDRLKLFIDVCLAVQHAHQKGIIHRDLKPSNIMVTIHDDRPVVKVIDFGVAKALDQTLTEKTLFTRYASMIGTPLYMSPEQARMSGLDVDTRSDVYSLGVILYELLTGTTPFDKALLSSIGIDEFREMLSTVEPLRPSVQASTLRQSSRASDEVLSADQVPPVNLEVKRELDWIVMKALEKDRERRYDSAKALADDVNRFLSGDAVLAFPPSLRYRAAKFVMRNRTTVGLMTLVFVLLCSVALVSLWQVKQVRQAWQESRQREQQATDLLEVLQLQSSVLAFRESDYSTLPELLGPDATANKLVSQSQSNGSMQQLLINVANPAWKERIVLDGEVADCVWDDANECLWVLLLNGDFYRVDEHTWSTFENHMPPAAGSVGGKAYSIAVSPSGDRVAIGTLTAEVSLWSIHDDASELRRVQVGSNGVESIAWSPDGSYIVAGTRYERFWVGDREAETVFRRKNDHRHEAFVFADRGSETELFVSTRGGIDVYQLPSGKKRGTIDVGEHRNARQYVLAGESNRWLVAAELYKQSMVVVDRTSGNQLGVVSLKSTYPQSIAVFSGGRWVAVVFPNGLLQILNLNRNSSGRVTGEPVASFYVDSPLTSAEKPRLRVLAPSRRDFFITAGSGGVISKWSLDDVLPVQRLKPPSPLHIAYPTAPNEMDLFFREGHSQNSSHCDRPIPRALGARSVRAIGERIRHELICFSSQMSKSGWIACAGDHHVTIYDLKQRKVVRTLNTPFDEVRVVEISQNGDAVAIHRGGKGGAIAWYSDDNWKTATQVMQFDGTVDGGFCFLERDQKTVLVWEESSSKLSEIELHSGRKRTLLEEDLGRVNVAVASRDGNLLVLGTDDGIRVYDSVTCQMKYQFVELSAVHQCVFLPDDRTLISGHESGAIRAWHVATGQGLGTLYQPLPSLGIPSQIMPFEKEPRLLVNYHQDGKVIPVILGTKPRQQD